MAPRLIRRRPLSERLRAALDPIDNLLWLSEKLDTGDWDQLSQDWANVIGVALNICFVIARANSGRDVQGSRDNVFGDDLESFGWSFWFASFIVHLFSVLSVANASYTFLRRRHYRLFESSINEVPSTPSAHRVKVQSSPVSSSPLRFLSEVLATGNAEFRSHPDGHRDVWEIALWDPTPISLRLFCFLSPGHTLVYWLLLPTSSADPRPSATVLLALLLSTVLTVQMRLLCNSFSQQSKDASVIHKEVMHEYDTKFVHPHTQHQMRDVGTQFSTQAHKRRVPSEDEDWREAVDIYKPTYLINKGFHVRPNPAYAHHVDSESQTQLRKPSSTTGSRPSAFQTPSQRQPYLAPSLPATGGNLGVYSHASSPLRKSTSSAFNGGTGQRDRQWSPQKLGNSQAKSRDFGSLPNGHLRR